MNNDLIEFLKNNPIFHGLTDTELNTITPTLTPRLYQGGEVIFREHDLGNELFLVKSGLVRIFLNSLDGTETSIILCGKPGDIFGELAVIDAMHRSASALAITETVVFTMTRHQLHVHLRTIPQLALNFLQKLSMRVRYNTKQVDSLATMDVSKRLARKLLELAKDYGIINANGTSLKTQLTQSDLASLIGATRESTNKVLRLFRKQGLVEVNAGIITILNLEALHHQLVS
jgi:CRP-like cAMP-binding protein